MPCRWRRPADGVFLSVRRSVPYLESPLVDLTELRVLCALCKFPDAPAVELARSLALSPSTVSQAKARLRRRGAWRPAYVARYDPRAVGPIVGFWGRARASDPPGALGESLARIAQAVKVPACAFFDHEHFAGFALPGGLAAGLQLESEVLGLREAGTGRPVVDWFRMHSFTNDLAPRTVLMEHGEFLERLLPPELRPGALELPRLALEERLAPKGPSARRVAADILANPHRRIDEGAKACGISVSTYAHTKSALLRCGAIERRVHVDLGILGYRFFLLKALEHRPAAARGRSPLWLEGTRSSNAPILFLGSSLCSVAITPYRTPEEVREAEQEFSAWSAGQEPLVPPLALCFDRATVRTFVHAEPDQPSVAHLLGVGRTPFEFAPES